MPFPTSELFISKSEAALGVRLPDSLREHLVKENGGELRIDDDSWQLFPVADTSDPKRLARSANHIVREAANARMWTGFPPKGVAIASNGSGNLLILLPDDADESRLAPTIYLWDHETGLHHWVADDLSQVPGFRGGAA